MYNKEESDLWWYFLSNHWRFNNYDGCCQCYACEKMREEFNEWVKELKKGNNV